MPDIKDMIVKTYMKTGARPPGAPDSEAHDAAMSKAPAKLKSEQPRTVGNISIAMQAQRIFNPNLPPAPPMKAPTKATIETGTAPALGIDNSFLGKK